MACKTPGQAASAREYMRRRRAAVTAARRAAKAAGEQYVEPTLAMVFAKDNGVCYLCGCRCSEPGGSRSDPRRATMDHVVALSNGGLHMLENLRCCCFTCNRAKSNALVGEYREQLVEMGA